MTHTAHMEAQDQIVPSIMDSDLWNYINNDLIEHFGGRYGLDDRRDAFETTCKEREDAMPLHRFVKRCRINCMWAFRHDLRTPEEMAADLLKAAEEEKNG